MSSNGKNPACGLPAASAGPGPAEDVARAQTGRTRDAEGAGGAPRTLTSPPLPSGLVDELAEILAEALVADLKAFPNLASDMAAEELTANSPRGHDRSGLEPLEVVTAAQGGPSCRGP